MEHQYKNYAFISYKREDEKWAKWLQRKLENYKLPSVIRKESLNMPKYIRPVFRDKTDLTGGVLAAQLHNELQRSKYLIVICSPNSAQSTWVNKEAAAFIEEGRTEHIIPFIVGGIPHAEDPKEECFPEVLRNIPQEQELLGINVQAIGREKAFIRLAAYMIGVNFDSLWQRHRRQEKRKRAALAACLFLLMGLGIFYWDYTRSTYKYYADYVDCWGVPKGVIELSKDQVSRRYRSYKFEYRRIPFGEPNAYDWRLIRVSYTNSAGTPQEHRNTEHQDRYAIQHIEYSKESGVIVRINYCKPSGKIILRHNLSSYNGVVAAIADFMAPSEEFGAGFIGASTTSMSMNAMDASQRKSNIKRYAYERDAEGYIIKQTFHANNDEDLDRSNVRDGDGIFGIAYTLDSLGRRINIRYLNKNGELHSTQKGIAGKNYVYEKSGNISKTTYIGLDGAPILNEQHWAICIADFDDNGNLIDGTFYFSENEICYTNGGFAKYKVKFDKCGNDIEETYWDIQDNPCYSSIGAAKITHSYDSQGRIIEEAYFDTEGNLCSNVRGEARTVYKYDSQGNQTEIAYFNANNEPSFGKEGFAKRVNRFDEKGNLIEWSFFDPEGNPCSNNLGIHRETNRYDSHGNRIAWACYGTDNQPCLTRDNAHKGTNKYDERGNITEWAFYGINGEPCANDEGNHIVVNKYDALGNRIECAYFDTHGNPRCGDEGIARWTYRYDSHSNLIEVSYFDINGQPYTNSNGEHKFFYKYDSIGNCIEVSRYDANNNPCVHKYDRTHKRTNKYDEKGNIIEIACYDIKGDRCLNQISKTCVTKCEYNDIGLLVEESYFDEHGSACYSNEEIHRRSNRFDTTGRLVGQAFFDTNNMPLIHKLGFAMSSIKCDRYGNIIEITFFDTEGNPCYDCDGIAKAVQKYNTQGLLIEQAFFDVNDMPCLHNKRNYSKAIIEYDNQGNKIKTTHLGINGELLQD